MPTWRTFAEFLDEDIERLYKKSLLEVFLLGCVVGSASILIVMWFTS